MLKRFFFVSLIFLQSCINLGEEIKSSPSIAGKKDNTVLFRTIEEQISGMNATLTAFDDCGHMAFIEKRNETFEAMQKFWLKR